MTPRKTPGSRLVESLRGLLEDGYEFDEAEEHLLSMIESETDRVAALRAVLADELAKDQVSTRRVTELSAEIRLLEMRFPPNRRGIDNEEHDAREAEEVRPGVS
ncbi:hypothetical protein QM603_21390 [Gordonia alkanivorans]|uniref:hypothetical protein n=1 Tax=Gordonia alkanivorans TaxID=84096 RepID=UPI0024B68A78|nr:hypothetical protein [Gordonia alkanivorans]MDJ0100061.1 hypothetical protein [Gordonia alkanivorans]